MWITENKLFVTVRLWQSVFLSGHYSYQNHQVIRRLLVPSFIGRKPCPKLPHSLLNYVLSIVLLLTTVLLSKQYSSAAYLSLTFPRSPAEYLSHTLTSLLSLPLALFMFTLLSCWKFIIPSNSSPSPIYWTHNLFLIHLLTYSLSISSSPIYSTANLLLIHLLTIYPTL